jgi:hypothetical protein
MLAARQAADVLHHLSDFVLKEPSPGLAFKEIADVRAAVEAKCAFLRTAIRVADVRLLRDIADAFKHHRPDRNSATVAVSSDVVHVATGYGRMDSGKANMVAGSGLSSQRKTAASERCPLSFRTSSMRG